MDTDTNVYNFYGCFLAANEVVFFVLFVCLFVIFVFNINFCWCNLLIHVASMIIVRSV